MEIEGRRIPTELVDQYHRQGLWTNENLGEVIANCLRSRRSSTLTILSRTKPYEGSFGQVLEYSLRLSAGLANHGVGPGDALAFQLPNWLEGVATFYGAAIAGCTVVPIPFFYGPKETGYIIQQIRPKALVIADSFASIDYLAHLDSIGPALDVVESLFVLGRVPTRAVPFERLIEGPPGEPGRREGPETSAVIAYTSGTTADPKGVVHSHRSILAETRQVADFEPTGPTRINAAPIGHAIGMMGALLVPLLGGADICLSDLWDPPAILEAMTTRTMTAGSGSPFFLQTLVDHQEFTDRHRELMPYVALGGGPIDENLCKKVESSGTRVLRLYGSTEHPSVTATPSDDVQEVRVGTDGRPMAGVEVKLADPTGRSVEIGEEGEVLTRGPDCCEGYTDSGMTKERFDQSGWYSTGDLGMIDERGNLSITGRKSEIIIRAGENISAAEVETVLQSFPGVAEVAVVGGPDTRFGERVVACVRVVGDKEPPTLRELRLHARNSGLSSKKLPEELHVVPEFPRNPMGKIQKFRLRSIWEAS